MVAVCRARGRWPSARVTDPLSHRPRAARALFSLAVCTAAAVGAGCTGDSGPALYPVAGTVSLQGKTLRSGTVSFRPDAARGNQTRHLPHGTIGADGRYELQTGRRKGAPPGWYKILVFADNLSADFPPRKKGGTAEPVRSLVHARYLDAQRTDLAVKVVAEPEAGAYDLNLKK
jgi:hypothetical protein